MAPVAVQDRRWLLRKLEELGDRQSKTVAALVRTYMYVYIYIYIYTYIHTYMYVYHTVWLYSMLCYRMTHYIIVYYVIKFGRGPVEMLGLSAACQRRRGDFGHAYIYIYIYIYIYEYIWIYIYMYTHTYIHNIYIYTHTYITHVCIYIYIYDIGRRIVRQTARPEPREMRAARRRRDSPRIDKAAKYEY